jgi:hypothetical protein
MVSVAEKTIELVKESMQRCLSNRTFMDKFYDEFMMSPEVQEKFKNTNMAMQKIVLKSSLHLMLAVARGYRGEAMDKLALSHDRNHRAIPPNLYQFWLNAMVSAVKATDVHCTLEVENAWREVMQVGANYMGERY